MIEKKRVVETKVSYKFSPALVLLVFKVVLICLHQKNILYAFKTHATVKYNSLVKKKFYMRLALLQRKHLIPHSLY